MRLTPKKMLLMDCTGALLSAFLLGIVLVNFQAVFGMPANVLCVLAAVACAMACYSFLCFWLVKEKWQLYLKIVAYLNLAYCLLTAILAFAFFEQLTSWGIIYFTGEAAVIVTLAAIELKIAAHTSL